MIVSWMTTNECNLRCSHCYQDAGEKQETELNTEEAKKMIDEIAEAGFRIMIFSGGEPLLRPDIYELVSHAKAAGLKPVFGTNGTLITKDVARQLRDAGTAAIGISLDSLTPEKHDRFRGVADAYRRTIDGIHHCKRAGLPFQIHTTVMDWNQGELLAITDYAAELGAIAHYIFFLIPTGRGADIEDTALESVEYEMTLRRIMAKQREVFIPIKPTCAPQFTRVAKQMEVETAFQKGCLAGQSYCVVGSGGVVRPCAYMTETAGDVREGSFAKIWRESPLFASLRAAAYSGSCGACEYNGICGGCRARAGYYHGGDIMAEDKYCAHGRRASV
jgi:putative heme d1 biosynthesis radical SAM protein NirJ2